LSNRVGAVEKMFKTTSDSEQWGDLRSSVITTALAFFLCATVSAEPGTGSICVVPVRRSEKNLLGQVDCDPAKLSLRIDTRQVVPWPQEGSLKVEDLDQIQRHLVALLCAGKPLQTFKFRFSEFKNRELCLYFDSYQGVQLEDRDHARRCNCKGKSASGQRASTGN
jgi:hypothetical protein